MGIRRMLRHWCYGAPETEITEPFDQVQATTVLNAVMQRGTFPEVNQVMAALGQRGYTGFYQHGTWQLYKIQPYEESPVEQQS